MSTNNSDSRDSSISLERYFLKPLEKLSPPTFPRFPKFQELVAQENQQTKALSKKDEVGLFEGLLGDPGPLYQDQRDHPEKYSPEASKLLSDLESGTLHSSQLSSYQKSLLDQATLSYSQTPRPPPPAKTTKPEPPRKRTQKSLADRYKKKRPARPRPGKDVPVTALPPYWWLA